MPKLPVLSGKVVIKALSNVGYDFDHESGSHVTLVNTSGKKITIPKHSELGPGILEAMIKQSGLTVEEFLKLL